VLKYLNPTLKANEGKMTKAIENRSFNNRMFGSPSFGIVKTNIIPTIPKTTDEQINMRVAIFCICLLC